MELFRHCRTFVFSVARRLLDFYYRIMELFRHCRTFVFSVARRLLDFYFYMYVL